MILSNARERTRFLRFLAVGVVGASVDFGVMNLLTPRLERRGAPFRDDLFPGGCHQ